MAQNKVLKSRDIAGLADYIASDKCKNIVLMLGAGVSTSAGIPDFRSPETGLYANLARLKLPYPEAVFEINFFRQNPEPFYTLAHELYPGKFRPTVTHSFIRLLAAHQLLHTCFTQNIDTLERIAGVPDDKIIEAHGSFATQRCIDCKRVYDDAKMKEKILAKETPRCEKCSGLVKPDIVFFGESLPDEFIRAIPHVAKADLLIIMGTSMTVQPFASLAERVMSACPRVLINLDMVGSIGRRPNDVVLLGKCDDVVRALCKALKWEEELEALWAKTDPKKKWEEPEEEKENDEEKEKTEPATAEDVVGAIADAIEKKLDLKADGDDTTPASSKDGIPSTTAAATEKEDTAKDKPEPDSAKGDAAQDTPDSAPGKL
ncbi:NAD-dependent protein deacetylase [Mycena sanguinolenta]|uniref:NAD-dependent protein deacetylase n=1 Tax=Mycena sanguinolenta TaxID=230812 RepID=A0A8H6XXM2_9AGAR|nr:NAD-dependent protein deacetylase [Mycena sanguinolenta]